VGFFDSLGMKVVFSSDTSEEQYRTYGKGRITMDSCYPVKALAGHIGELLHKDINILFVPMIYSLPSFLEGACDGYTVLHAGDDGTGEHKGGLS
jgi:predicted nucleotide-binding protein (sugar kinase/HSP70/actin superfamily)